MKNIVLAIIIAVIVGASLIYLHKQKKQGNSCVGCPYSKECKKNKSSCTGNN